MPHVLAQKLLQWFSCRRSNHHR